MATTRKTKLTTNYQWLHVHTQMKLNLGTMICQPTHQNLRCGMMCVEMAPREPFSGRLLSVAL